MYRGFTILRECTIKWVFVITNIIPELCLKQKEEN